MCLLFSLCPSTGGPATSVPTPLVAVSEVLQVCLSSLFPGLPPWVSPPPHLSLFLCLHFSLPHPLGLCAFAPKTPLHPLPPTQRRGREEAKAGAAVHTSWAVAMLGRRKMQAGPTRLLSTE